MKAMSKDSIINHIIFREKRHSQDKMLKKYRNGFVRHYPIEAKLSRSECSEVKRYWERIETGFNLEWCNLFKKVFGEYDVRYVPEDIWTVIQLTLNVPFYRYPLQHKVLLYRLLPHEVLPDPVGAIVKGSLLGKDFLPISVETLVEELSKEGEVFCKYADPESSGSGKGIQIIDFRALSHEQILAFVQELLRTGKDHILQRSVRNSSEISRFSTNSLNTIRMMTLNINGKVSYLSAYLRMASNGSRFDNVGNGGLMVPLHPDGTFYPKGYNMDFEKELEYSSTGIKFEGQKIEAYEKIKSTCLEIHGRIPYMGFVAWDVTLDENGEVRVVEINLDSQDVADHQFFNGPLFGDRTEEVIQYVVAHPVRRLRTF